MVPLRALLVALCWRYTAAGLVDALQSPRAYSFEELPQDSGTLASSADVRNLIGLGECECHQRCLSQPTCRGYGYNERKTACLLTELLPTLQKMDGNSADWRWYARNGVRRLGEPCAADWDCSPLVPAATCVKNVCSCRSPVEEDGEGGCRKVGSFIEVSEHQLTSGLLSEAPNTTIDTCKASCAGNISCVAFDFSAAEGRCRTFSAGVTSDVVPSGDVQSFVWRFARADGTPPNTYQQAAGSYLRMLPSGDALKAATGCFMDGAILFPGVTMPEVKAASEFSSTQELTAAGATEWQQQLVWLGLTDILEEGSYVTSDDRTDVDIAWDQGQGVNVDEEDCAAIWRDRSAIHDARCEWPFPALCQYVGENLALHRLSWMNAHRKIHPAKYGNDGNQETLVHSPYPGSLPPELTWTVDLGGPVQVSSVLYLARTECCEGELNRNRLTEIRVGSDPTVFDEQHSARCAWREKPFVARANARLLRCAVPLTGRYVHLIRRRPEQILDFAELAVFGNRLQRH